jgi:hypothetical protein
MSELTTQYDPVLGALAVGQFQHAPEDGRAVLSGRNLRAGLLATLWQAELLAAQAGVVPWFPLGDGQRGVAVVGAARERLARAPDAVRVIYLATHGAARQAQSHARGSDVTELALRTDRDLAKAQRAGIGGIDAIPVALVVLGIAAIVAGAWFAKGSVEKLIQTRGEDLRASYAADTAAKLAMAQIAAGMPVDPSVWQVLKGIATRETAEPFLAPALAVGGLALVAGAAAVVIHRRAHG